jgi:hypothetical protein
MSRIPPQAAIPFRPAPFPIYDENYRRRYVEWMQRLAPWLCLLIMLLPQAAGPSSELLVPVRYALVELDERVPVVLELDLPPTGFVAQPASLGYFLPGGEFVYSATVTRGLLYGQSDGVVQVIEITAPLAADAFITSQLATIRDGVAAMNAQENLLYMARDKSPSSATVAGRAASDILAACGPGLDKPPSGAVSEALARWGDDAVGLSGELLNEARHRARLKQLYYEGQAARLRLMLTEFDLQIALARLPQADYAELLSLGDEKLVRDTMLGEIARLQDAWEQRQTELDAVAERDRSTLASPEFLAAAGIADPFSAAVAPSSFYPLPDLKLPAEAIDPEQQLAAALARSRLVIAETELSMIATGLAELERASLHVQSGKLPGWTDLPRMVPELTRMRMRGLEALSAYAAVEAAARQPKPAADQLLSLALSFESCDAKLENLHPHEVAYGVLAVDRCLAGLPTQEDGDPTLAQKASRLGQRLDAILAFPADYDAAAYSLGLLHFFRWYTGLAVKQQEYADDILEDDEESAVAKALAEAAAEDKPARRADVDALFD